MWLYTAEGWVQEPKLLGWVEIEMVGDDDDELLWWWWKAEEGKLEGVPWEEVGSWPRTPFAANAANTEGFSGTEKTDVQSVLLNCWIPVLGLRLSALGVREAELRDRNWLGE